MDKSIWREKYHKNGFPRFPCPNCRGGVFKRLKDRSFEKWDDKANADPMYSEGKFALFFECSHGFCGTVAVMSGVAVSIFEQHTDPEGDEQWEEEIYLHPKGMTPGPRVIAVPVKTPKLVSDEITKSFSLLWTDRSSAANKLRNAVEEILADFGIPRTTPEGKFVALSVRLDQAEKLDIAHHGTMAALKDVGNTGSHEAGLPLKDLLDAYDILEDALEDIYGGRKSRLDAIRARLTKVKPDTPIAKPPMQVKAKPSAKP